MIVDRPEYCSWYNPNKAGKGFALPCSFPQSWNLPYSQESSGGNSQQSRELLSNAGIPQNRVH
jgi:hypothetical protein